MGSKSSPSSSVSDSLLASIYNSSTNAAALDAQNSADSLAWSKEQYAQEWPYVQNYMNAMTGEMNQSLSLSQAEQSRLENLYWPVETQYAQTAEQYASPAMQEEQAGAAQTDVANSYTAQRSSALQSLESYGIDPSQTRYGAMDLGTRISQAAAEASAGTSARMQTQQTGIGLLGNVVNIGSGYPASIASSAGTGTSSGGSGVSAGLNTSSTYGSLMGTATQWGGLSNSSLGIAANAVNSAFSNELSSYNASTSASQNTFGGIGSLVGGLGTAALLKYSDERLKEDIRRVGKTDAGIPVYTFKYKYDPSHVTHMGVLAQELERRQPEAVHRTRKGIRLVDYGRVR